MPDTIVKIAKKKDIDNLLFICLRRGTENIEPKKKESGCYYAVFNEIGENIELVFGKQDEKNNNIVIEKVISPSHVTSGNKLREKLQLKNSNFMSLKRANEIKYLLTNKQHLRYDDKCGCLVSDDYDDPTMCPEDRCIKAKKTYIINQPYY